ncbi:hypothetical protein DVH05_007913 [Phytophthora capsici]|nr:hypothetical protein DVH05_011889 [Phytophthora capsici]KAG1703000.1 hypothetical protein DVH05_007913 [Phytophthora capsici]
MQQGHQTGNAGESRRSLTSPFVSQSGSPYQPASFLSYPAPLEPSARSYSQQQQVPPSTRYWQSPSGMDTSSYGKQRRHTGSLDLDEFGGILDPDSTSVSNKPAVSEAADMNMTGFDVHSLHDGMGSAGFHPTVATAKPRFSTTPKSTRTIPPSSDPATIALVNAAYMQSNESSTEPDLKTEKLTKDNRNEKCQYPDCPNRARVSQSYGRFCNRHVIVSPCGFPGCREKAMERTAMCVKHMELGKEALQVILDARTQNVPVCKMTGCFKNDQGRGYCRGHEKLLMATGRLPPHINKRRLNSAYTMCSYPECNKHSQRHHLCRTHGNLINKQAQELADRPGATETFEEILGRMQKEMRRCTYENCTKNSQRDRLCTTHYYEKHNLQKDGSAPPRKTIGSRQSKAGSSDRSNVRTVEQDRCGKPGCGNLSYAAGLCVEHTKENQSLVQTQGRYGDLFSSGDSNDYFADSEAKPAMLIMSEKPMDASLSSGVAIANAIHSKCTNPMCDRESYGRDYCEACQRLFSPLVVAINPITSGYASSATTVQPEETMALCRVSNCGQECVRGGLCATHLRAFRTGSLSVDDLKLDSHAQQQHEQELAEAAAVAAAAAEEAKQASPTASNKSRKYYCKIEGCGKQAQKRNLCKRHYRLQEGVPTGHPQAIAASRELPSNVIARGPQPGPSRPSIACQFPSCSQDACSGSVLCLAHSKATFCWQPGCENLVGQKQFCEFHAFRQQCAYEGCMYTAQRGNSGCANHLMARRCRHAFCDKFAVGSDSGWCRLHQISCQDAPCALCKLHSLPLDGFTPSENENSNRSHYVASSKVIPGDSSGNMFGRNARLM